MDLARHCGVLVFVSHHIHHGNLSRQWFGASYNTAALLWLDYYR
jgi:hypothetical protein